MIRTVVVTEAATCAGIFLLLTLPLGACLAVLPLVGIALNGTSSVLYGTVADLVASDRRARSYAIFYTVGDAALLRRFEWGGRGSNPRPTDNESLVSARATRPNGWPERIKSPGRHQI